MTHQLLQIEAPIPVTATIRNPDQSEPDFFAALLHERHKNLISRTSNLSIYPKVPGIIDFGVEIKLTRLNRFNEVSHPDDAIMVEDPSKSLCRFGDSLLKRELPSSGVCALIESFAY